MRWDLVVLLIGVAFFLTACPPATPPPTPEQACVWQPDLPDSAKAVLVPTATNTQAGEPITADNASRVRELARLGRGRVSDVYPGMAPDTVIIVSQAGVELYDFEQRKTLEWFYQIESGGIGAASPDGRRLLTSRDSMLMLWDLANGKLLCSGDTELYRGVIGIAWSPDGKQVATSMDDGTTWVWNPDNGGDLRVLGTWRPTKPVERELQSLYPGFIAWSPDSRDIAYINGDHELAIWDLSEPQPHLQFSTPRTTQADYYRSFPLITAFDWSLDGECVRVQQKDGAIETIDAISGARCDSQKEWATAQNMLPADLKLQLSEEFGQELDWSPESDQLAASGSDSVSVWDPVSRTVTGVWQAPSGTRVRRVEWLADGLYRLLELEPWARKESDTELAWDRLDPSADEQAQAGAKPHVLQSFDGMNDRQNIYYADFSPDGTQLVTIAQRDILDNSSGAVMHLWDLTTNSGRTLAVFPKTRPSEVLWSPDGSRLAIPFGSEPTQVLDASSGELLSSVPGTDDSYIKWLPDSKRIEAQCPSEAATPQPPILTRLCTFDTTTGQPLSSHITPSTEGEGSGARDAKLLATINLNDLIHGGWSPDGKLFATLDDNDLLIREVETGGLLHKQEKTYSRGELTWSPDGRMLASSWGSVYIWGIPAGKESTEELD